VVVAGIVIAGIGSLLLNIQGALALPLGASLRLGWMALIDLAPQVASAILMLTLVAAGAGLLPFYFAPVAAGGVALLITAVALRGEMSLIPAVRPSRWRSLISQTFVYAVATATGAAYFRIAMIATSLLSTGRQTGYFALAFRILELSAVVPWLLVGSAFPILVRSAWNDDARLRYALGRLSAGSLILGGWLALCLVVGAPVIIHVLSGGGHGFDPAVPVLRILGAALALTFQIATFSYTLLALQMYRTLISLNLATIALAFVLAPLLVSPHGAEGAAVLSLTLEIVLCAGYVWALVRARPELRPSVAGFERIVLALVLGFGAGIGLPVPSLLKMVAGSAVLLVSLWVLRAIPGELMDVFRRAP
jgi:O-antigen/teichoic acid export membrane protein